jgi:KaiC/GvpD/RAD55 family RecA-like ATPase
MDGGKREPRQGDERPGPDGRTQVFIGTGWISGESIRPAAGVIIPGKTAFRLVRFSDLVATEPDYLVGGLLERDTMALVFGDPAAGKSFLTIDLGACVATGTAFHGRPVKRGAVIYIAGEGHGGLARRRMAWETERGIAISDDVPFYTSTVAGNFLDDAVTEGVLAAIRATAETAGPPALIVVDTLARNFGGGDENSTQDMNRFIAAIDRLKAQWPGCTALIVHHTGHGNKGRSRGSMALFGAVDAEYRVEKDGMAMTVTNTKMKDGPPPAPMGFEMVEVQLSTETGAASTSLALRETAAPKARAARPLAPSLKAGLDSFARALAGGDEYGWLHVETWRPFFYDSSTADTQAAKKKAFQRVRTDLVDGGHLTVSNEEYRYARLPE